MRSAVDDMDLWVEVFLPREPDPQRFSGAALHRYKDVYRDIADGKTTGLSIGGANALRGSASCVSFASSVPCYRGAVVEHLGSS
jgi:hypothetical protein